MALPALNRENGGANGVELAKKAALTAFNRKNCGVNGIEPEK